MIVNSKHVPHVMIKANSWDGYLVKICIFYKPTYNITHITDFDKYSHY